MTAGPLSSQQNHLVDVLRGGLEQLGLLYGDTTRGQLLSLLDLLTQWNRTYNLTAIRDPEAMVHGHLLDSLSVLPYLPAGSLLDLGCGAGFPGLPIAICDPDRTVTLLDSNQKKTRFVQHAIAHLELKNCHVVHQRVQQYLPPSLFDTVICRAYSALSDFVEQADSLLKPDGTLIAMKGQRPSSEMAALPPGWQVTACDPVQVPNLDQPRHLVLLQRDQAMTQP